MGCDFCDGLARWAAAYDATLNRADPLASGFQSPEAEAEFDRQGLELLRELQAELGDAYKVTYYSYTQHRKVSDDWLTNQSSRTNATPIRRGRWPG